MVLLEFEVVVKFFEREEREEERRSLKLPRLKFGVVGKFLGVSCLAASSPRPCAAEKHQSSLLINNFLIDFLHKKHYHVCCWN